MKLGELREIFKVAEVIYRQAGDDATAEALKEVSSLCDGRESMTVGAFAKLVASIRNTS